MSDDVFADINKFLKQEEPDRKALSDYEIDQLILAFATGRGEAGFFEEEVEVLLNWAISTRVNNALLDLAIKGLVTINTQEKKAGTLVDLNGPNLTVMITEEGKKHQTLLDS